MKLGLLALTVWVSMNAIGRTPVKPSPLLPPTTTGTYRLDDLLEQAEVDGLEPETENDLTLYSFEGSQNQAGFQPLSGIPMVPAAAVEQGDGFVRISGSALAICSSTFPTIPARELGMVVLRVRSHKVPQIFLSFADRDTVGSGGGGLNQRYANQRNQTQIDLPTDGEWHTLITPISEFDLDLTREFSRLNLLLGMGIPRTTRDASIEIEYIHLLDRRAPYVHAVAATTELVREGVARKGFFVNVPSTLTYSLEVPPNGHFLSEITVLEDRPVTFLVTVDTDGDSQTVFEKTLESPLDGDGNICVDLSAWSGQEIELSLEVLEESDPTVAFFLHPMVSAKSPAHRNVLVYFCDTLRADALSCYGNERPTTPNLDALANDGVRFERCFSQASWTYVSMPSAFTSLQPTANGVRQFGDSLSPNATTFVELFRKAGYLTAAYSVNPLVGKTTGIHQGFDIFFSPQAVMNVPDTWAHPSSPKLTELALSLLDHHPQTPILLFLHAVDPHAPYQPPLDVRREYISDAANERFRNDMATANGNAETEVVMGTRTTMSQQNIDADRFAADGRLLYDAELDYFDQHFGHLMDELKARDLYDDLVITFNSDHGEEFLDHDGTGHGQSLFGELITVPWIVRAPGIQERGRTIADNVSNLDLAPTLLGLAGLSPGEAMQGRNLTATVIDSQEPEPVPIVCERHGLAQALPESGLEGRSFAVIEGPHKTIVRFPRPTPAGRGGSALAAAFGADRPELQIFDTRKDPLDQVDMIAQKRKRAEDAKRRLLAFLEAQDAIRAEIGKSAMGALTASELQTLRALGYLR